MTTINSLDVLAARVEAADGPDRELDCAIAVAAMGFFECEPRWPGGPIGYGYIDEDGAKIEPGHGGDQLVKRFTASLDAAMTLAADPNLRKFGGQSGLLRQAMEELGKQFALHVRRWPEDRAYAQHLARFLCAAALRARSHLEKQ